MRYIYGCRFAVWLLLPMETANMQAIQILRKRTQTIRSPKSSNIHILHSDIPIFQYSKLSNTQKIRSLSKNFLQKITGLCLPIFFCRGGRVEIGLRISFSG